MKFSQEITINLPREKVVELFDNPDNMQHWQKGLITFKHLSGIPGKVGAQSLLKYRMGKREIEMTETITKRNLPDEFSGVYEAKGVWNEVRNFFIPISEDQTLWRTENNFKFRGAMKLMAAIMPKAFKKQSYEFMENFKSFAEKIG